MGVFLPVAALPGLKQYKYASEDQSLVSKYVLKPFYLRAVEHLPRWLAPNMVTLLGLLFSIVSFVLALTYNRNFDSLDTPRWVYFLHAFDLFMYQTLDALDGQQARRTGTSSPLGELFDHCVDAINTSLQAFVVATVFNWSKPLVLLSQFMCTTNFFLSTWEEYHTHKLFLSVFSGPVEGILMLVVAEILTGTLGPTIWRFHLGGSNLTILRVIEAGFLVGLIMNCVSALSNVHKATKGSFRSALGGIVPFIWMWVGYIGMALTDWNTISGNGFLPFFLSIGLTFALLVGRIITAHVTTQAYPTRNYMLLAPFCGLIFHLIAPEQDSEFIWGNFGVSLGVYGCFVAEVISEICFYLDIGCLRIKEKHKNI